MFNFIVRYFGFLKHVPLAPHIYDALLKIQLFFINRGLLDHLDEVEETVLTWSEVSVSMHKYGGTQFNVGRNEFGHLHGNGLLDVRLNRKHKSVIMKNYPVMNHHVFKESGWISFWIKTPVDRDLAVSILREAYLFRTTDKH